MTEHSGELGFFSAGSGTLTIHDPNKPRDVVFFIAGAAGQGDPTVTFRADGSVEVRGDSYEAAKAFWDYVKQFAAAEYAKHAATHHEIRDLGEFVAERKGKE